MDDLDKPVRAADVALDPTLQDWRFLVAGLVARFDTGDFAGAVALVRAIEDVSRTLDHPPDVDLRPGHVVVRTTSRSTRLVTGRDVEFARLVSGAAAAVEAVPRPDQVSELEIAVDAVDSDAVRRFWAAVLGRHLEGLVLVDPSDRQPGLWLQPMDPPRTGRNRIHLDITLPHELATSRVAEAVRAGGRLVSDDHAPAWWVLADPEGDEVCVCTAQGWKGGVPPPGARLPADQGETG